MLKQSDYRTLSMQAIGRVARKRRKSEGGIESAYRNAIKKE